MTRQEAINTATRPCDRNGVVPFCMRVEYANRRPDRDTRRLVAR